MEPHISRRQFLEDSVVLGAAAAAVMRLGGPAMADEKPEMPTIRLGDATFSRLLLGSNPFYGYAHRGGDVAKAMREYFTDERIMESLDEAARVGITAAVTPPEARWLNLWAAYRKRGGKLPAWIAQPHGKVEDMEKEIDRAVEGGAKAAFIQGLRADGLFQQGNFDRLRQLLQHIRSLKVPAGIASHRSDTHLEYQKREMPADFYFQCFYPNDKFLPEDREKAVAAVKQIAKPVVGYKILAAGRLPAKEGFEFALKHLAPKDGVCVGVFPKDDPDQIEEDAKLAAAGSTASR
jgi:hypothetical protein